MEFFAIHFHLITMFSSSSPGTNSTWHPVWLSSASHEIAIREKEELNILVFRIVTGKVGNHHRYHIWLPNVLDLCSSTSKIIFCVFKLSTFSLSIFLFAVLFRQDKSTIKTFLILGPRNGWLIFFIVILTGLETKWCTSQLVCDNDSRKDNQCSRPTLKCGWHHLMFWSSW